VTNYASVSTSSPGNRSAEIFTQPIEIILRINAGIINAFQSATVGWMQRRQEAARDTIESFEKLVHCRDIGEAMTIQREWVKRSMHRLDEDFSPLAGQTPDMLQAVASAGETAVVNMSEAAQPLVREVENHVRAAQPNHQKVRSTEKEAPNQRTKSAKPAHGRRR
jgi:hypothetical protein